MSRPDQFIPHLIVSDGVAAIEFYKAAFGVEQGHTAMAADGKRIMHGDLSLDGHRFFISDEFSAEEGGSLKSPQSLGGTSGRITLEVDDADHRKLHQRPDDRHGEQHPFRLDAIGDEAYAQGGDGEQEEEGGAQQAELLEAEVQLLHDRHGAMAARRVAHASTVSDSTSR